MSEKIRNLENIARQLRKDVMTMVYECGDGHPGPAFSIAEIIAALYFNIMKIDPANTNWAQRDRLILSKGHACPVLYAALARKGYFSKEKLCALRECCSILQGHPDMKKTPGIDMTSGSLGNGLSIGIGMALAGKYFENDYYVYVIMGDGELEEGVVWEGMMSAVKYNLGKLIVFVDNNGFQSGDEVQKISGLLPILSKFEAFRWHCQEIDGHNINQIINAVVEAKKEKHMPSLILAHTVKGKGVYFMENDNSWHKRVPSEEQYKEAMKVLGGDDNDSV